MIESLENVSELLPSSIPVPTSVITVTSYVLFYLQRIIMAIPGAHYMVEYIAKSHQDDPYRTMVELGLILYGIVYYLNKPRKQGQAEQARFTAREEEQLIAEWEPEPLVDPDFREGWRLAKMPQRRSDDMGNRVTVMRDDGRETHADVLDMASYNCLRLSQQDAVVARVEKTIRNYGVGSCGPAGFYGNQDLHYNLEYELARFFGTENAVLYGQDFCVASSVIPAFTKRGDVIVADDQVSVALQNALQLSRSTVYYFKHNDMKSLEELLTKLDERDRAEHLPALPRKFIVTEGLFQNSGDIAPLPELVKLKGAFHYRLVVDETNSLGVLGNTGRGLSEHFNVQRCSSIDITIGSMATALGSSGGFVLGDNVMSRHQRIGSNAYCFSASLPPYTCAGALAMLQTMDADNSAVQNLRTLAKAFHASFTSDLELAEYILVTSNENSSVLHLQLAPAFRMRLFGSSAESIYDELVQLRARHATSLYVDSWEQEERFLQRIVDRVLKDGVLITRNTVVLKHESLPIVPSLKAYCHAAMSCSELERAHEVIKAAIIACCAQPSL
ncbi:ABR145Cp [Eremothecium gossypii ATCC 10895]|uniref:serine C-palmitoyltransferase n=1 Tax=Eremothecium gossypii (strain ATCC 10895 / CBS 109.51 / FGSC 9923 / NRRL Y-1056) TaxID=284811 RepID=Q75D79_EREGS|nr:ABR145Cp [Eremothecium gossypii ATCC 10895]AAS50916.2 ABR145Cp [Eremothecium gossypii ATCC 10895]AEY95205.1 FABR145Cp [Eremothecium gossypii FDAG1]